jgi:hypothetical protein
VSKHLVALDPSANLQFWLELYQPPTPKQVELVTQIISAWFIVGKMGGFNGINLQVCGSMLCRVPLVSMCFGQTLGVMQRESHNCRLIV